MIKDNYDVIIVGGGTAGVSCAWNCGSLGLSTLLVEKNTFLGGSITSSLVIPAMKTSANAINTDFFDKLYNKLSEFNGVITYSDGNKGWFNPEYTKIALDILMKDADVDVLYEHEIDKINVNENKILSVYIDTRNIFNNSKDIDLLLPIETRYLVDATGDAKIFQKLNCDFLENIENEKQPISLRFIMSGININKFSNWLLEFDKNRDVTTACTVDGNRYLSTAYTWDSSIDWALRPIFEKAISDVCLKPTDCNYFQVFSVAGTNDSLAFNCPRLVEELSRSNAYTEGRLAILRLSDFCKKYLPGFEYAHISSIADSLGVRVSNRIKGKYIYKYEDLIEGKAFENAVLKSNYPVDIHSDKKDKSTLQKVNKEYQLPLESLMSVNYNNLYAIGRCISADFKAQAALRIIPSCFSMGEGLAKYLAKSN